MALGRILTGATTKGSPVPTKGMVETAPPQSPEWRTLATELVDIQRGGEIYSSGHVDPAMRGGSGLRIAGEFAPGRELPRQEESLAVGITYAGRANIGRSPLQPCGESLFWEGVHTQGDRS